MKRKFFVSVVVVIVIMTALLSTACIGSWIKTKPLKDYDFSIDNVIEIRMSSSPMYISLHGTIYGVTKGDSEEGDELISEIAQQWTNLQQNAVFRKAKKHNIFLVTGGSYYYECVFKDGSSIKMKKNIMVNLWVNDSKSMRLDNEEVFNIFHTAYKRIMKSEYIVGHISPDHDENCNCDVPPTQDQSQPNYTQ